MHKQKCRNLAPLLMALLAPMSTFAQLAPPNSANVSMGHLHFNSADPQAQTKFWTQVVGAKTARIGTLDVLTIPGTIIFINKKDPSGGTEGSVVNHIGVTVRDLAGALAKAEAAHAAIVSRNEKQAMLLIPDGIRVELTLNAAAADPVSMHHIHFYTTDVEATRKWYAGLFGATPGRRGPFEAADLPGVNLSFSKSETALSPTKGRALDHIGFEVRGLEAFAKKLEADGVHFDVPYKMIPSLGVAIAFFTDPWGTYIELTEGLDKVR